MKNDDILEMLSIMSLTEASQLFSYDEVLKMYSSIFYSTALPNCKYAMLGILRNEAINYKNRRNTKNENNTDVD